MRKKIVKINGFSLMEIIISLAIIMIITLGIYSLIIISLKLNADNAFFTEATEIANQKMEQIRNLSYDDVGTISGFPAGVIPQDLTITREGTFDIHTSVIYYDDPYDGEAGTGDLVFADYKIVTINVSWIGKFSAKNISIFSKVIPATEETTTGYGLLKLNIVDSNGAPVPNPDIKIENPSFPISMTIVGDTSGKLSLPLPPGFEVYEITVSKTNYGTERTYARDLVNVNPTKVHLSIFDGLKTEESFSIDKLSLLTIKTLTNSLPDNWAVNHVSTSTTNSNISAGADSSNNIYIAWQNSDLATSSIFIQKFNSSYTAQWVNPKTISTTNFQTNPDITTTSNGNSFVAWQDNSSLLKAIAYVPKKHLALQASTPLLETKQNFSLLSPNNFYPNIFSTPFILNKSNPYKLILKKFKTKSALAASGTVTLVSVGPGNTETGRYITLTTPAGIQANDLLIAFIQHDDASDGPILPPSGENWNTLDNNLNPGGLYSNSNGVIFWKLAETSENSSHQFYLTYNADQEKAGHIRAYRGVDISNPFDGSLVKSTTYRNNQYHSAPSKTVSNDGSMLVCGWGADTYTLGNVTGGPTFPAGMGNSIYGFIANVTASAADMPVNISDSPTSIKTYNARQNVTHASMDWCLVLRPEILPNDVLTSSIGNQEASLNSPSTNQYVGGAFVFTNNTVSSSLTDITITEEGTINAILDTNNIKLFYDLDITAPYDCSSEQYDDGLDSQFGISTSFDGVDGKASFNEALGVNINPTQTLCVYPVVDILSSANSGDTLDLKIKDPSTEITLNSGTVSPITEIAINGLTNILKPAILNQIHYKFREDNGDELSATSLSGQDNSINTSINSSLRIRFEISNEGDLSSSPIVYSLEYGERLTSCDAIVSWNSIPSDSTKHWEIVNSSYLVNDATTTNISAGLTDENTSFKEGYLCDLDNQTPAFSLDSDEFTEIEFNLKSTTNANETNYCFRLTDNGSGSSFLYSSYPMLSITGDNNIFVHAFDSSGSDLWATKKINSDTGDADQRLPKIASTESLGIATSVIAWEDNRDGDYNIYAQSIDANRNILWGSDLQITSSSTDENSISIVFDSLHKFYIAWIDNSSSNNEIYLNKFDLDGNMLWASEVNITNSNINEYSPQLSIDSSDNIYLSYSENNSGIFNSRIKKMSTSSSEIWDIPVNINSSSFNQFYPRISISGTSLYTSWTDQREGNNDIYSQKYDLSGNPVWADDQRINVNTGSYDQTNSFLVSNSGGDTVCSWLDNRDDEYNVYAAEVIDPILDIPAPNIPIIVTGEKKIGDDPIIYKYNNHTLSTDASGVLDIMLEWDPGYTFSLNPASTSLSIIKREPVEPLGLLADSIKTILIYVK